MDIKDTINFKLGSTRQVFVFKNFVIKIPNMIRWQLFLNGLLANIQESQFSGCHSNLARVLWISPLGFLLVMEKARVLNLYKHREFFKRYISFKFKNDDMYEFLMSDCKPDNWGYVGKRLVKIDYGS